MKYFIEVSYKGSAYHGWQIQKNASSVQEVINDCFSKILQQKIEVYGSGRTDTGVHCLQQFAHFVTENQINTKDLAHRSNAFLPKDIAIKSIKAVTEDAHARFSALSRKYIYKITTEKNPFLTNFAYQLYAPLHLKKMQEAADMLLQWQDYTAFSKTNAGNEHHLCDISEAFWKVDGNMLYFQITANRFLRGMVRLITGALLQVGMEKMSLEDFKNMLESKKRDTRRFAVPAQGLYLTEVKYPDEIFINE
ncbi:MAG: tRNA pseudouridine(38-40) synthase TruA [Thalassobius sp.]|nr:tRNA pseudouridine(38-40) synthase TruA [Thalassovita sp.]